ncbi:MAG: hypothetical protein KTR20_06190 [Cellvibrionaceae bacterium]|nr:hypothetical protein [Cellvibrionaceae bacterium]
MNKACQFTQSNISHFHPITELFIPQKHNSDAIIFPLVASLSAKNSDRWLTWITHRKPNKQHLLALGAQQKRLRIIHRKEHEDNRWLMWEALAQGSSDTVICDLKQHSQSNVNDMEIAAARGQSFGIMAYSAL